MTDEPENLTLKLLRDIRSDIAKVREEMREGFERTDAQIAEVKTETAHIPGIAAEVAALGVDAEDIKESLSIIEGRLVRLEKHAGLVKS